VGQIGLCELEEVITLVPCAPFSSEAVWTRTSHCSC